MQILLFLLLNLSPSYAGSLFPWEEREVQCLTEKAMALETSSVPLHCDSHSTPKLTLTEAFCDQPQRYCEAFEEQDSGCSVSVSERVRIMESPEGEEQVLDALKEMAMELPEKSSKGTTHELTGVFQPLYQGEKWAQVLRMVGAVQGVMLERLEKTPGASPEILNQVKNLHLINPYDPKTSTEDRESMVSTCQIAEDWNDASPTSLGAWNAFALPEGQIVICPQVLLGMNEEGLIQTLLHEVSHLIGPCVLGHLIWGEVEEPECGVDESRPEQKARLDWVSKLRQIESCFHQAGVNDGKTAAVVGGLVRDFAKSQGASAQGCIRVMDRQFIRSKERGQGLLSQCDLTMYLATYSMSFGMEKAELKQKRQASVEAGGSSARDRFQSRMKEFALWLKTKRLDRLSERPDSNQFNEVFSDVLSAHYFPEVLTRYRAHSPSMGDFPDARMRFLDGLSWVCREKRHGKKMKNESHGLPDQRMQTLSSQAAIRKFMGCKSDPPTSYSRGLNKCMSREAGGL